MKHSAATGGLFLLLFSSLSVTPAAGAVVNIDIERPGDATHSGSDGVLSDGGAVWNSVLFDTPASDLVDETGGATTVGIAFHSTMFESPIGIGNSSATNDLQDSGVLAPGLDLLHLDPAHTYSLAVYGSAGSVVHAGGSMPCPAGTPTYVLPGVEGEDYCLFTDLVPFEVTPGVYGLQLVGSLNVSGIQLLGSAPVPDPPVDVTPPSCSMVTPDGSTPEGSITVVLQDTETGIASIDVRVADNVVVSIDPFTPGTTDPVAVRASTEDPYTMGMFELESTDEAGNSGACDYQIASQDPPPPPPAENCAAILEFFDAAVSEGTLTGLGPGNSARGRLSAFRHMLGDLCGLWEEGETETACLRLSHMLRKCDGNEKPQDFVTGEALPELVERLHTSEIGTTCGLTSSQAAGLKALSQPKVTFPLSWGTMKSLYED